MRTLKIILAAGALSLLASCGNDAEPPPVNPEHLKAITGAESAGLTIEKVISTSEGTVPSTEQINDRLSGLMGINDSEVVSYGVSDGEFFCILSVDTTGSEPVSAIYQSSTGTTDIADGAPDECTPNSPHMNSHE